MKITPVCQAKTARLFKGPERNIVIASDKNGKDVIKSEFIGYHAQRAGLVDLFRYFNDGMESLVKKILKVK